MVISVIILFSTDSSKNICCSLFYHSFMDFAPRHMMKKTWKPHIDKHIQDIIIGRPSHGRNTLIHWKTSDVLGHGQSGHLCELQQAADVAFPKILQMSRIVKNQMFQDSSGNWIARFGVVAGFCWLLLFCVVLDRFGMVLGVLSLILLIHGSIHSIFFLKIRL